MTIIYFLWVKKNMKSKKIISSDIRVVNDWFYENVMVLNPEKSHFMCLGKDVDDTETLSFTDLALKNSKEVEILGKILDRSMGFNTYIKSICRKADQKL